MFVFLETALAIRCCVHLVILCLNWNFLIGLDQLDHISENIVTESTSKRVTKKKSKNRIVKEDVHKVNGIDEALKTRNDAHSVSLFSFFLRFNLFSFHVSLLFLISDAHIFIRNEPSSFSLNVS